MSVKIGHAVSNEFGKATGGKSGNQTGKELCFSNWYNEGWNVVLRAISTSDAEKIAKAMEVSVNNKNIGYDQAHRTTYYTEASKVGFNLTKVMNLCECDCSSLVSVCVNTAGIKVSKDIYTGNMVKALMNTGKFEKLTDKKYLTQDSYLKRGDILVHEGSHTAIALTNSSKIVTTQESTAKSVNYYASVTAFFLNVRSDAAITSRVIKTLKKDTVVRITKEVNGWGYIEDFKGWVSLAHIKTTTAPMIVSPYIAITTTTVNFRTSPDSRANNNIITKFNKGQYLVITKERIDGWVYGKSIVNGIVKYGWIFKDYVKKVNKDSLEKRRVTDATGLNIRVNSNSKAPLVGTIPFNKEFYVVKNDIWGIVVYNDILGFSNLSKSYSEKV